MIASRSRMVLLYSARFRRCAVKCPGSAGVVRSACSNCFSIQSVTVLMSPASAGASLWEASRPPADADYFLPGAAVLHHLRGGVIFS